MTTISSMFAMVWRHPPPTPPAVAVDVRRVKRIGGVLAAAFLFLALGLAPARGQPLELGLTPSHVYGLWTNINDGIVMLGRSRLQDPAAVRRLESMLPRRFEDKIPGDVLKAAAVVRGELATLRRASGLEPPKAIVVGHDDDVTPSLVFLNSGHVLDGIADLIVREAGQRQPISPLYRVVEFVGKEPSDVFGMVDLAARRLAIIVDAADEPRKTKAGEEALK